MSVINVWDVVKDTTERSPILRSTLRNELKGHRTRINEIVYGDSHLWSSPPITHTAAFRVVFPAYLDSKLDSDAFPYLLGGPGDCIRVYDVSSLDGASS